MSTVINDDYELEKIAQLADNNNEVLQQPQIHQLLTPSTLMSASKPSIAIEIDEVELTRQVA